jgi:hypothetical protein
LGWGGLAVSGDAWGAISYEQAKAVVAKAVDVGINFFDTAAVYGRGRSEEYLGRAVKELDLRDRVYIATKIHGEWLRRVDILTSVENQRRRLGVDAIDLYQIHWPACWHNTPICETIGGADKPGLGEVHRPDLLPALKGSSWAVHRHPRPAFSGPSGGAHGATRASTAGHPPPTGCPTTYTSVFLNFSQPLP